MGRLVFHLFGALAQFEREIIRDRTVAGSTAARARGRVGGRPSKLSAEQRRQARKMYDERQLTVEQIGKVLGVSRTLIYRALGQSSALATRAVSTAAAPLAAAGEQSAALMQTGMAAPADARLSGARAEKGMAPSVAVSQGRSCYFVVEADPGDPERGPVAVLSGHTSQKVATTALKKARGNVMTAAGEGEQVLLQVRAAEQITSRLVWESQAKQGVIQPGPPTRPSGPRFAASCGGGARDARQRLHQRRRVLTGQEQSAYALAEPPTRTHLRDLAACAVRGA